MRTKPITFRLIPTSAAGQIYQKWILAGYKPRQIFEIALQSLEGIEPPELHGMQDATLVHLQGVVERLEAVAQTLQNGGVLTNNQKDALDDALGNQFVQGMKRLVKPGFTSRPSEE